MGDFSSLASTYYLELQWALAWFPLGEHPNLSAPVMRSGLIQHSSTGFSPTAEFPSVGQIHWLGEPDALPPLRVASAFAEVDADLEFRLSVRLEIRLGAEADRRKFDAPPGKRIPFMLNIAEGRGTYAEGTGLSLWGTIVTTSALVTALRDAPVLGGG